MSLAFFALSENCPDSLESANTLFYNSLTHIIRDGIGNESFYGNTQKHGDSGMRRWMLLSVGLLWSVCLLAVLTQNIRNSAEYIVKPESQYMTPVAEVWESESWEIEKVESLPAAGACLPYKIEGTTLVAERLVAYDGPFVEDGSDREVINVAALILHNFGSSGVKEAEITLAYHENSLTFQASMIPPGATAVVLEKDGKPYIQVPSTDCYGWAEQIEDGWDVESVLRIEQIDIQTLQVTNITSAALHNVQLYYKTLLKETAYYIGGITYQTQVLHLKPGETVMLQPPHYAKDYSEILRVATN